MHFSLDLWNTLIKPNREYAEARNGVLAERLCIETHIAAALHRQVKRFVDHTAETEGAAFSHKDVYRLLAFHAATVLHMAIDDIAPRLQGISGEFARTFRKHPPIILPATKRLLKGVTFLSHTFSISSNTNFISGIEIETFLRKEEVYPAFAIYSDLEGVAKPNPLFFQRVRTFAEVVADNKEIVHIGDNPICDNPGNLMKRRIISGPEELTHVVTHFIESAMGLL